MVTKEIAEETGKDNHNDRKNVMVSFLKKED